MGIYTKIFTELKNRFESEMSTGKLLDDVKKVQIGSINDNQGTNVYPQLLIKTDSGFVSEEYTSSRRDSKRSNVSMKITVIDEIGNNYRSNNVYFNDSNSTGILNLIERVLDVLQSDENGVLNPRFLPCASKSTGISLSEIEIMNDQFLTCDISINIITTNYTINDRRNA